MICMSVPPLGQAFICKDGMYRVSLLSLSLSKAVLLHRKPASAMTSHNICCDHGDKKKGML